jgi:hypothetical protein
MMWVHSRTQSTIFSVPCEIRQGSLQSILRCDLPHEFFGCSGQLSKLITTRHPAELSLRLRRSSVFLCRPLVFDAPAIHVGSFEPAFKSHRAPRRRKQRLGCNSRGNEKSLRANLAHGAGFIAVFLYQACKLDSVGGDGSAVSTMASSVSQTRAHSAAI